MATTTNSARQTLIDEWHRNEAALVVFAANRGGHGDLSALELVLLGRQDEIEFELGSRRCPSAESASAPPGSGRRPQR